MFDYLEAKTGKELATKLNDYTATNKVSIVVYTYAVSSDKMLTCLFQYIKNES